MVITIVISPSFSSEFIAELSDEDEKYSISYEGNINDEENMFTDKIQRNKIFLTELEWNSLIKEIIGRINIIPENIIGFDGTTYEITIENGSNKHQFSIWEILNNNHPLSNFIQRVIDVIKFNSNE